MPQPSHATLELLERLVGIDSTSVRSNLPVIEACVEALSGLGAWTQRVVAPPHPYPGGDQDKAGLLVRIGPDVDGGVVLSGHTDCVPVEGQPWTTDPFALTQRGDTVVGRGTTDMKAFIAAALTVAAPAAAAASLARPLWLLLTWDEEIGCVGAGPMTDALLALTTPSLAIVGEPTSLRPATSHKGVRSHTVTVHGTEGHSSRPDLFANALVGAAKIVTHIDDVASKLRDEAIDPRFEPPYTSFGVNVFNAGTAINIIPREATFMYEYRPVPANDSWELADGIRAWADEHVVADMQAIAPDSHIEWQQGPMVHGLGPEADGAAEALVRQLTGFDGDAVAVPFGTDGGWHQSGGISTVVCGPGNIEQAHQPDEWLELSQLGACEQLLTKLVTTLQH